MWHVHMQTHAHATCNMQHAHAHAHAHATCTCTHMCTSTNQSAVHVSWCRAECMLVHMPTAHRRVAVASRLHERGVAVELDGVDVERRVVRL